MHIGETLHYYDLSPISPKAMDLEGSSAVGSLLDTSGSPLDRDLTGDRLCFPRFSAVISAAYQLTPLDPPVL